MTRRMYRYVVPVDDQPYRFTLTSNPLHVDAPHNEVVEFWAEHADGAPEIIRAFQVFGTGQLLPADAQWWGTCRRTPDGLVWHLYEVSL